MTILLLSLLGLRGGDTVDKFAGLGLKNLIVVSLFTMLMIIVIKTIAIKHPVPGLTEAVAAI